MTATATATRSARPATRRRRRKPRRSRRWKAFAVTAIVLVIALLGSSLWILYFSSALVTKQVNVIGTRHLTPNHVNRAVQIPHGVPLARQDLEEIARRAMTVPAIETATATRDWPHTITVRVVERRPVVAVHQQDGYLIVDKLGVPYQRQPSVPGNVVLAEVNPADARMLTEVATVAAALPAKMRGKVARITGASRDNLVLILASGVTVSWGNAADSELKAQVATALLKRNPKSSMDVSSPHNPAVK